MPLACFLPKVVSTIKIQILLPKSTQEAPRDHWHCAWANLGQKIWNTKTAITLRVLVAETWNFYTRCLHQACTILQNCSSISSAVQKLLPKRFIFNSFQDPWPNSFQDHPYFQNTALFICIQNFLSRPLLIAIVLVTFSKRKVLIISRPSDLVYFQDHGRWTTRFSTPEVWLAHRGPATGIWWVEGSDHISVTCIQHQQRYLVCHNYWLSRQRRFQMMEHTTDIHWWGGSERLRECLQCHRRHPWSLDLILEPHRWDLQWHQTRQEWVNWPTWSENQESHWKMPVLDRGKTGM